jgi:hypothetical protein
MDNRIVTLTDICDFLIKLFHTDTAAATHVPQPASGAVRWLHKSEVLRGRRFAFCVFCGCSDAVRLERSPPHLPVGIFSPLKKRAEDADRQMRGALQRIAALPSPKMPNPERI